MTPFICCFFWFFFAKLFSPTDFFFLPSNKLSSQRGLQLLPYKASPIRTSACTTSPLSSPLFAFCVRYVVFEEAEGAALRSPFGLTIAPATYSWIPYNSGIRQSGLTPSILHSNWFLVLWSHLLVHFVCCDDSAIC